MVLGMVWGDAKDRSGAQAWDEMPPSLHRSLHEISDCIETKSCRLSWTVAGPGLMGTSLFVACYPVWNPTWADCADNIQMNVTGTPPETQSMCFLLWQRRTRSAQNQLFFLQISTGHPQSCRTGPWHSHIWCCHCCFFQINTSKHGVHGGHWSPMATLKALCCCLKGNLPPTHVYSELTEVKKSLVRGHQWFGNSQCLNSYLLKRHWALVIFHSASLCHDSTNISEWKLSPLLSNKWCTGEVGVGPSICTLLS